VYGRKLVIVQGLHTFHLRQMREQLDLKLFLSPHPLVRLAWKVRREVTERGHALDKVLTTLRKRAGDSEAHINPQKLLADWMIKVLPTAPLTEDSVLAGETFNIKTQHIMWNDAAISGLLSAIRQQGLCSIDLDTVAGDINQVRLCIAGHPSAHHVAALTQAGIPDLPALTRGFEPPTWHAGQQGINQLIGLSLLQASA
jgi:hypothetical protein